MSAHIQLYSAFDMVPCRIADNALHMAPLPSLPLWEGDSRTFKEKMGHLSRVLMKHLNHLMSTDKHIMVEPLLEIMYTVH